MKNTSPAFNKFLPGMLFNNVMSDPAKPCVRSLVLGDFINRATLASTPAQAKRMHAVYLWRLAPQPTRPQSDLHLSSPGTETQAVLKSIWSCRRELLLSPQ